jgi:hypothetical protein
MRLYSPAAGLFDPVSGLAGRGAPLQRADPERDSVARLADYLNIDCSRRPVGVGEALP